MNYLYIFNATFLCLISGFVYSRRQDRLALTLCLSNIALAVWNVCVFVTEEFISVGYIDLLSKLKLAAILLYVYGIFYFCISYPYKRRSRFNNLNFLVLVLMVGALMGTNLITHAEVINGELFFQDHPLGFPLYSIYILFIGIAALTSLIFSYRKNEEHRGSIKYLFVGLALFTFFGILFNLILPAMNQYDYLTIGRLSGTFPPLFFAYVMTKHDFMSLEVIINRSTSWLVTIGLIVASYYCAFSVVAADEVSIFFTMTLLGVFWAIFAARLQNFLLTSARRKFVRSWYSTEDVITELSEKITSEKNRESIFSILESVLDGVYEIENVVTFLAERDQDEGLSHYVCKSNKNGKSNKELVVESKLVLAFAEEIKARYLDDCSSEVIAELTELGFKEGHNTVLVPFHSPEILEGILVLGERSNQTAYNDRDIKFFNRLTNYMSAIFYRLTPIERLENIYFESRQKLHEAEIQLLRAQKIESIVHATRQCHHEIRTPLNIIRLGIGRIKQMEDLENYKTMAQEEIARALEVVEETLAITDVNKAQSERFSEVNLNEVLSRCERLVDKGRYTVDMVFAESPITWGVFSDLQVLVTNLIHNAVDAMPDGGAFRFETKVDNDLVFIEIEDNGQGIPDDLRSRVWEPYFSGHKTEVGNSNAGRGWGLTIVNRIVTEHEGTIKFESELGKGTTFILSLKIMKKSDSDNDVVADVVGDVLTDVAASS